MTSRINANCLHIAHLSFLQFLTLILQENDLNHDLEKINEWVFQSRMWFNPKRLKK